MSEHYLYIIECSNHSLYTGYTTDLERRYLEHVAGSAKCKYTRSFPPLRLAAYWRFTGPKRHCLSLERKMKALSKTQKTHLINDPSQLNTLLTIPNTLQLIDSHLPVKREKSSSS